MAELHRNATVLVQGDGSIEHFKGMGNVSLDKTGVTIRQGRRRNVFVNLEPGDVTAAEVVKKFVGTKSSYRPVFGVVLRIEATTPEGEVLVGIVVASDESDEWLEAAGKLIAN